MVLSEEARCVRKTNSCRHKFRGGHVGLHTSEYAPSAQPTALFWHSCPQEGAERTIIRGE